jgi:hypothetical protein
MQDLLKGFDRVGPGCRTVVVSGGNGISKSSTLYNMLIGLQDYQHSMLNPWLKRYGFFSNRDQWANFYGMNGTHSMAILMRRDTADNVFLPEIEKWAPRGSFKVEKSDKHFAHKIRFRNGGLLTVYTPQQDIKQFAGPNYDAVWADEPFLLSWYTEGLKRSRGKGPFVSFMTPKADTNAGMFIDEVLQMPEKERVFEKIHLHSACKSRNKWGFRSKESVDADERTTPPADYDATVCGEPMALAGKVLKEFDPLVNLIDESVAMQWIREEGCSWYLGIDPHPNLPHLVAVMARLRDGRCIFVDEWPRWVPGVPFNMELTSENWLEYYLTPRPTLFHKMDNFGCKNPDQFARVVKHIEQEVIDRYAGGYDNNGLPLNKRVGTKIEFRYVDPNMAATKSTASHLTLQELWWQSGLHVTPSRGGKIVDAGHELMDKLFGGVIGEDGLAEPPMLFIVEKRCFTLSHHAGKFSYKSDENKQHVTTGGVAKAYNESYKHGVDAMRYPLQMNPIYMESQELQKSRQVSEPRPQKPSGFFAGA